MEQAGEKTFFGAFGGEAFGESDFLRGQGSAETMCPEVFECFSREAVVVVKGEGLKSERECFDDLDAGELHCFGGGDNWAACAEMRGVDDVEEFCAEAGILFDDFGNFPHVDVRGGEQFAEAEICFRRSGQGTSAAYHFADAIVADEITVLANAAEKRGECFKVERFAEEAMADGEAFSDF